MDEAQCSDEKVLEEKCEKKSTLKEMDSVESVDNNPNCFIEDYSVKDCTLLDSEISNDENLHKHPVVDELFVLNNEWINKAPKEISEEETLRRLELEALIKRAEDKLLPEEHLETAQNNADVVQNLSEDEGFQLRLSCIIEESESDASGSGVILKTANKNLTTLQPTVEIKEDSDLNKICDSVPESENVVESSEQFFKKRGQSLEPNDSIETASIISEKVISLSPRFKIRRRGRSLESGLAEKCPKGKSKEEEKPPVPPETYLWEELKRWRLKGGYPWTHIDKPPFDEKTWKNETDHEYEPINPPPLEQKAEASSDIHESKDTKEDEHVLGLLRIPNDDQLVISAEDMEVEAIEAAREYQSDIEDRFLATSMTTTTASRTDCDVNTSMLDSSGLEDLPLKRDSRSKKSMQLKTEQMRLQAQGLQQRIRTQAGKLRNKLRNFPRPSFQRKPDAPKTVDEKPRFRLSLPERPRFKMPQKPKISLPSFSKPLRERQINKVQEEPRKNLFDLDFKTYPRMFNKKSKERGDYATSSPKQIRSATPPPPRPMQPTRKKGPVGQRWVNRFDDIRFVDERASEPSHRSDRSESLSDFHDKDFAIGDDELENVQLPPARTISTKSSISHLSDRDDLPSSRSSEDRHRKGVIEEIDSDQFFLRQKGISQEDIDMGKYLSEEIREAFRAPVANALQQLDLDYETAQTQDSKIAQTEPQAPTRTRSLKRMTKVESQEQAGAQDNDSEYYKTPPPPEEYLHYKVPRRNAKRKHSAADEKQKSKEWVQVDIETSLEPTDEKVIEHEYIIPKQSPPDVPKRTRSLSRGPKKNETEPKTPIPPKRSSSKSLHSLNIKNERFVKKDPDCYSVQSLKLSETKRGTSYSSFTEGSKTLPKTRSRRFQSLATGVNSWGPQVPQRTRSQSSVSSKAEKNKNHYQAVSEDGYAGYAVVEKIKPARPPPPRRRKHSPGTSDFNTFPRNGSQQPARPVRNYATLGPSRPPRRSKPENRSQSVEHIYTEETILHGSNKDLQASDVVEKMKIRPLPAPPRPPRIKAKSEENNTSVEVVEEICVATQTDPLPDDLCLEEDIIQEFSHEQMKIQQEFLLEMQQEEERIRREMEAKRAKERSDSPPPAPDEKKINLQEIMVAEDDMGYASLDRRQTVREDEDEVEIDEPVASTSRSFLQTEQQTQQPVYVPLIPTVLNTETLRVGNLEVDQLRVNRFETNSLAVGELTAQRIIVQDVTGTSLAIQNLSSNSGQLTLNNIEIPPEVIQQIIARIPWEDIVPARIVHQQPVEEVLPTPATATTTSRRRHRAHKHQNRSQASSDEELVAIRPISPRRSQRAVVAVQERPETSITNLGRQLAIACTDAGVGAISQIINRVRPSEIPEERARYIRILIVFALIAIAGYILFCLHGRDIHHHHWDFQFPPQPPRQ